MLEAWDPTRAHEQDEPLAGATWVARPFRYRICMCTLNSKPIVASRKETLQDDDDDENIFDKFDIDRLADDDSSETDQQEPPPIDGEPQPSPRFLSGLEDELPAKDLREALGMEEDTPDPLASSSPPSGRVYWGSS